MSRKGTQSVFSSSTAPPAKARAKTKSTKAPAAPATPPASTRSATGDLWSGVASPGTSPISAAEATAGGQSGGIGNGVVLGLAILGIGIAGLTGAFVVTTARRRATSKSNTR